jgi:hypothetical protein
MTLPQSHRATERDKGTRRQGDKEIRREKSPCLPVSLSPCPSLSLWLNILAFLGLALCANVLHSGCRKTSETPPDIVFEHKVAPDPPTKGPATVTLKLADSAGKPIVGARVNLEGNMSHPGMRPVFGEASEAPPGRYEAALEFTMGGDWVIIFHITLPDGRSLQRQIDVKGVRSG